MTSDVLAFAGGALEAEYRGRRISVTIGCAPSDIDRVLVDGQYDVATCCSSGVRIRVLPTLVTGRRRPSSTARTTTSAVSGARPKDSSHRADDSMMAACDGGHVHDAATGGGYDATSGTRPSCSARAPT